MEYVVGKEGQSLREIDGRDLAGCIFTEKLYTLGLMTFTYKKLGEGASSAVMRAHSFIYPGHHEPYYPHLASQNREALVQILRMVEGKMVVRMEGINPVDREERVNQLVRKTCGLINPDRTCVLFTSGYDARLAQSNDKYYPRFVRLLSEKDFDEIMEIDPLAFVTALGCSPKVEMWEQSFMGSTADK